MFSTNNQSSDARAETLVKSRVLVHQQYVFSSLRELEVTGKHALQGADLYEGPLVLPEGIANLPNLISLSVKDTLIKEIPDRTTSILSQRLLCLKLLRNPELKTVSDFLSTMHKLETFAIDTCVVESLPPVISDRLTDFSVMRCKLSALHSETHIPRALRVSLAFNQLTGIPRALRNCSVLVALNLENNSISALDDDVMRPLEQLRFLNLKHNKLSHVDARNLSTRLEVLQIDSNYLEEIPEGLTRLSNLHYLSLKNNQITKVPSEVLREMRLLQDLHLDGNPLSDLVFGHLPQTAQRELQLNPLGAALLKEIEASFL